MDFGSRSHLVRTTSMAPGRALPPRAARHRAIGSGPRSPRAKRATNALLLDRVRRVANACGVDEDDRIALEIDRDLDRVAGGPGERGGDGDVAARRSRSSASTCRRSAGRRSRRRIPRAVARPMSALASARSMRSSARPAGLRGSTRRSGPRHPRRRRSRAAPRRSPSRRAELREWPRILASARRRRCSAPAAVAPRFPPRPGRRGPPLRTGPSCRSETRARRIRQAPPTEVPAGPEGRAPAPPGAARPPVTCSSTTSSPVKLRGAAKRGDEGPIERLARDRVLQGPRGPRSDRERPLRAQAPREPPCRTGPEIRNTATAAFPTPLACAKIVSESLANIGRRASRSRHRLRAPPDAAISTAACRPHTGRRSPRGRPASRAGNRDSRR